MAERRARGQGEDCVACHMPRLAISNIPHTAATDHRIPRGLSGSVPEGPQDSTRVSPTETPLFDYHWGQMTEDERRLAERDLGVALRLGARLIKATPPMARVAATQAVPLLEFAVRDRPDDLLAHESLGQALGLLDRDEEAFRVFEELLHIEPRHELALRSSGRVLTRLQRPDLARAALRKAIAVDPWRSELSPGVGRGLYNDGRLARGYRGLPRGDPAQPRTARGAVASGAVLPADPRAGRRPTPNSRP